MMSRDVSANLAVNCWALQEWAHGCGNQSPESVEANFFFPTRYAYYNGAFTCALPSTDSRNYAPATSWYQYRRGVQPPLPIEPWWMTSEGPTPLGGSPEKCDIFDEIQCECVNTYVPSCSSAIQTFKSDPFVFENYCAIHQSPQCHAWVFMRCDSKIVGNLPEFNPDDYYEDFCQYLYDYDRYPILSEYETNMMNGKCPCAEVVLSASSGYVVTDTPESGYCADRTTLGTGESCIMECRDGWRAFGANRMTCSESSAPPNKNADVSLTCTPGVCSSGLTIDNGTPYADCVDLETEQSCGYECNQGYSPDSVEIVCSCTGGADGSLPICSYSPVSCVPDTPAPTPCTPVSVPNSDFASPVQLTGSSDDPPTSVTCLPGYEGGGEWTCGVDGTFSGSSCDPVTCAGTSVPNSNYAAPTQMGGSYGGTPIVVTCFAGYEGGGDWTCGADGTFTGSACNPTLCMEHILNNEYCAVLDESCAVDTLSNCQGVRRAPEFCTAVDDATGINVWAACFREKCGLSEVFPPTVRRPRVSRTHEMTRSLSPYLLSRSFSLSFSHTIHRRLS